MFLSLFIHNKTPKVFCLTFGVHVILGRLLFILGYDVGVQEGNIRKTMAARGLVNGRGPRSGRDLVFRCYHPELLIGYLLFSFLEVFDLGEDFIGLSDDLAVYAEADDTSDDTSDCGKYQDHNTA